MLIAVFVGILSGLFGIGFWSFMQFALSLPGVYNRLGSSWHLVPPVIGLIAAAMFTFTDRRRRAIADLFEGYYFGVYLLTPVHWAARGILSLLNSFLGGTFGSEGAVLEFTYGSLPFLGHFKKLLIQDKQLFVFSTVAASLGISLGAPFSGLFMASELIPLVDGRIRTRAIVATFVAFAVASFTRSTLLFGVLIDSSIEHQTILESLFIGLRPMQLDLYQWILLSIGALGIGLSSSAITWIGSNLLIWGNRTFESIFKKQFQLGLLCTGLFIGFTVWLVPQAFGEPWRVWEEMAWLRLSTKDASIILIADAVILIFAYAGWGSAGLFSPMLVLGSLFGYSVGNLVSSNWAIPMAITGASCFLSSMFRVPLASLALILEIGHDSSLWWLAAVGLTSSYLVNRYFDLKPFHERVLETKMGLQCANGKIVNLLKNLKLESLICTEIPTISIDTEFKELREMAQSIRYPFLAVLGLDKRYMGLLAFESLPSRFRNALRSDALINEVQAIDRVFDLKNLMDLGFPQMYKEDSMDVVLSKLEQDPCLVVVDQEGRFCGMLFDDTLAERYKRQIGFS